MSSNDKGLARFVPRTISLMVRAPLDFCAALLLSFMTGPAFVHRRTKIESKALSRRTA